MNVGSISIWGAIATVVLTTLLYASQSLGLSRMSMPYMLGTIFAPGRDKAKIIGFGVHFANGWLFALIYALVFDSLGEANWWLGAIAGLVHGFFLLIVLLPMFPGLHPRMASNDQGPTPTKQLEPPGFMGLNYGRTTPLVTIFSHCVYGAIIGSFYQLAH